MKNLAVREIGVGLKYVIEVCPFVRRAFEKGCVFFDKLATLIFVAERKCPCERVCKLGFDFIFG